VKIVILSGHDEFEYAQKAINLGVTEYLLKPVTAQDLHHVLRRIAAQIDQERREREQVDKLRSQVEENRAASRERLLLNLVMGAVSSADAIEKGHLLGLDLVAGCYQVLVVRIELRHMDSFDYHEYQRVQQALVEPLEHQHDVLFIKKDVEEAGAYPERQHAGVPARAQRSAHAGNTTPGSDRKMYRGNRLWHGQAPPYRHLPVVYRSADRSAGHGQPRYRPLEQQRR
jgi:YesN/AraC family two-component response regulator